MNIPDASFIIVNYGGGQNLNNCLRSIFDVHHSSSVEIIVVDNCSPIGSCDFTESYNRNVVSIRTEKNAGYGYGCNRGAEKASGRYLFFLNNDLVFGNNVLDQMVEYCDAHSKEKIGAMSCILTDLHGRLTHSCGRFPGVGTQFSIWKNNILKGDSERKMLGKVLSGSSAVYPVDYVTGAALLVPALLFRKVGGFDERFFMYFEDTDLQFRLSAIGAKSFIFNSTGIMHLEGGGVTRSGNTRTLTYSSLFLFIYLRKGECAYYLGVPFWFFLVALHLCNRKYPVSQNKCFVKATFSALFSPLHDSRKVL